MGAIVFLAVDHFYLAPNSVTYFLSDATIRPRLVVALLQEQADYLTKEYEFLKTRTPYQENPQTRAWIDNHYLPLIEGSKVVAQTISGGNRRG